MNIQSKILAALKAVASNTLPEEAIKIDPRTRHTFVDTCFIDNDEIDLDELSNLLADAIDIRVDPAPEEAA